MFLSIKEALCSSDYLMEILMQFHAEFIKKALPDCIVLQEYFLDSDFEVSVDTRTLEQGDIFFAIKGSFVDGHDFLVQALEKGAAGLFIEKEKKDILNQINSDMLKEKLIVLVDRPIDALVACAREWRRQFTYPVIGVTGSVGKTSTKEMISRLFDISDIHYVASRHNQNTLIGAAINILRMRIDHRVALFEMGIGMRGEMEHLALLVNPTIAIITNIGHQHMDGIGSLADIAAEKRKIFKYFSHDSIGIINGDQAILSEVSYSHPVIKCGTKMTNQIQARKIKIVDSAIHFILKIYQSKYSITINRPHAGALWHSLFVAAVGKLLKIADEQIVQAIQKPLVLEGRFEEILIKTSNARIINDSYNANPESMKAALMAFQNIKTSQEKIAVIGDMLGLGFNSPFWHRQIGRFLKKTPSIKKVILVGDLMVQCTKKTLPFSVVALSAANWQEAASLLESDLLQSPLILVKGSRNIGLNNLVEKLVQ